MAPLSPDTPEASNTDAATETRPRITRGTGWAAAIVCTLAFSATGVANHSLWPPDEPRVAEIGREMFVTGDLVLPRLNGKPFVEKPPLYWWVMQALYGLFGVSEWSARMTSTLASALTLLLLYGVVRRIAGPPAAIASLLVLSTTSGFLITSHRCVVDPWLALFVLSGYAAYLEVAFPTTGPDEGSAGPPRGGWLVALYLAAGLAFLVKGPVGPALLVAPIGVDVIVHRRWRLFRSWWHSIGLLVFLGCVALWPLLMYIQHGPDLLQGYLRENVLHRVVTPSVGGYHGGHAHGPAYYLPALPDVTAPWIAIAAPAYIWLLRVRLPDDARRAPLLFLATVMPVGCLLLSTAGTKRFVYLLPLIAPLAAVLGTWIDVGGRTSRDVWTRVVGRIVLLGFLGARVLIPPVGVAALLVALAGAPLGLPLPADPWGGAGVALATLAAAGLVTAALAIRAWRGRSRPDRPVGMTAAWALFVLAVAFNVVAYPLAEPSKEVRRVPRDLEATGVRPPALVGYRLNEALRGIYPFETGTILENFTDVQALLTHLEEAAPPAHVLTSARRFEGMPEPVRSSFGEVRRWETPGRRACVLLLYRGDRRGDGGDRVEPPDSDATQGDR